MQNDLLRLHDEFCREALHRNYRPSTIKWWRESIRAFIRHFPEGEASHVHDVSLDRLRAYLFDGVARGWTADTFNSQRRSLNAFLRWCVFRGLLPTNPLDAISKQKQEKKLPKGVSVTDALRILEYAYHGRALYRVQRSRNRAALGVMIYAGLRASELLNLKLHDVDLESGIIAVRCGKGGKDRLVPIHPALAPYLREYLADRDRMGKRSELFFTGSRDDAPLGYYGLRRMISYIRPGTGIAFSAHRLRHTFATLMLEGGCDLFSLKEMMGHSDIQTTTIYLSVTMGTLKAQMAKHALGSSSPAPLMGAGGGGFGRRPQWAAR